LEIIGCREVNEPIFSGTYTVVTVLEKPIDYWTERGGTTLRWVHVDNNGKIDKAFHGSYGELFATNSYENRTYFKLDEKHYSTASFAIINDVLLCACNDTMKGTYLIEGALIDSAPVNFIAVRK